MFLKINDFDFYICSLDWATVPDEDDFCEREKLIEIRMSDVISRHARGGWRRTTFVFLRLFVFRGAEEIASGFSKSGI